MPILNYTTKIAPVKTITEIQTILGTKGASRVSVDYKDGVPTAIMFELTVEGDILPFRLPCDIKGVRAALTKQKVAAAFRTEEAATRCAWRIIKDWIEAQFALIEAGQAAIVEVFLPYAYNRESGMTMYQLFLERKNPLQLSSGD